MMKHLALRYSFDDLLAGLNEEIKKGYIYKKEWNGLSLFNYTNSCTFAKAWNDFTIMARGLILCESEKKIVALPLPKFFNYGEMTYNIPDNGFSTFDKLDGSVGILFYWKDEWYVSTRGSFESDQAKWGKAYLDKHINKDELSINVTYIVELIYPENKIVINYGDMEAMFLLTAYTLETGTELSIRSLVTEAIDAGFYRPMMVHDDLKELINISKILPSHIEGFVIRFSDGHRLKIKGDEYCRIHRLIANVTPLGVWRVMMANDGLNKIRETLPEEYLTDFNRIVELLGFEFSSIIQNVLDDLNKTVGLTDKQIGLKLSSDLEYSDFTEAGKRFIFLARKGNFFTNVCKKSMTREKVFKLFKPKRNQLENYKPSTVINRFKTENFS